jgi:hypothetical protein
MAEERIKRRLAAILVADVVGYSRLMGEDEAGALAAEKVRTLKPAFKLDDFATSQPYKDPDHLNRLLGQLRAAGLD